MQQTSSSILFKLIGFVDITLHRTVMTPAALPLDVLEVGTGAMCAGGQTSSEAMPAQFRRVS